MTAQVTAWIAAHGIAAVFALMAVDAVLPAGGELVMLFAGGKLHLGPARFARTERWFARFGPAAVFLGRLTPLVRSFVSIPAGVLRFPLGPYLALTFAASALWAFAFAGAGWALGDRWEQVHHAFRYADSAAVLAILILAAVTLRRTVAGRT